MVALLLFINPFGPRGNDVEDDFFAKARKHRQDLVAALGVALQHVRKHFRGHDRFG